MVSYQPIPSKPRQADKRFTIHHAPFSSMKVHHRLEGSVSIYIYTVSQIRQVCCRCTPIPMHKVDCAVAVVLSSVCRWECRISMGKLAQAFAVLLAFRHHHANVHTGTCSAGQFFRYLETCSYEVEVGDSGKIMEHLLAASEQKRLQHSQAKYITSMGRPSRPSKTAYCTCPLQDRNRKLAYSPSRSRWFSCTFFGQPHSSWRGCRSCCYHKCTCASLQVL